MHVYRHTAIAAVEYQFVVDKCKRIGKVVPCQILICGIFLHSKKHNNMYIIPNVLY